MSNLIERHELISFFGLAILISWIIWLLAPTLSAGDDHTLLVITLIGTFGPAVAGIFVARITDPERIRITGIRRWQVFILVFVIVDLIWLLSADQFGSLDPHNFMLFTSKQVLSALVAFILSGIFSRRRGIRDLLMPLTTWRVKPIWYLIAILGYPILIVLGLLLAVFLNTPLPPDLLSLEPVPFYQLLPGLVLAYVQTLLFQGPLGEEPGWRGFAFPKLQKLHGSLVASIILGVVWGFWHAPLYLTGIYSGGVGGMLGRLFWTIPLTLLFTWVYNRTKGSLLLSILLHTSINFQGDIISTILQLLPK